MVNLKINGISVQAEKGQTLLEIIKFLGIEIPHLCYHDGLTPYGACRLCSVEVEDKGRKQIVTSCSFSVKEGISVYTDSKKIIEGRKLIMELLLARCPNSKTLQDLASKMGVNRVRFKMENENCILCGLCVRMCAEQMRGAAISFTGIGSSRAVATPFRQASEECRNCGACMYICPVVELQCRGLKDPGELCNSCLRFSPVCLEKYDNLMCYLESCNACVDSKKRRK